MAVDIQIRMTDGPKGRKKGNIIAALAYPNKGFGNSCKMPKYTVIRIEDKDLKDIEPYCLRHVPTAFNIKGEILESARSKTTITVDQLKTEHISALELNEPTIINWSDLKFESVEDLKFESIKV